MCQNGKKPPSATVVTFGGFLKIDVTVRARQRTRSVERTLEELAAASECNCTESNEANACVSKDSCFVTGYGEAATGTTSSSAAAVTSSASNWVK